jgi:hypothetical protein
MTKPTTQVSDERREARRANRNAQQQFTRNLGFTGLPANLKAVLVPIAESLDPKLDYTRAWTTAAWLAKTLECSERTVERRLQAIARLSIFRIDKVTGKQMEEIFAQYGIKRRFSFRVRDRMNTYLPNYEHWIWHDGRPSEAHLDQLREEVAAALAAPGNERLNPGGSIGPNPDSSVGPNPDRAVGQFHRKEFPPSGGTPSSLNGSETPSLDAKAGEGASPWLAEEPAGQDSPPPADSGGRPARQPAVLPRDGTALASEGPRPARRPPQPLERKGSTAGTPDDGAAENQPATRPAGRTDWETATLEEMDALEDNQIAPHLPTARPSRPALDDMIARLTEETARMREEKAAGRTATNPVPPAPPVEEDAGVIGRERTHPRAREGDADAPEDQMVLFIERVESLAGLAMSKGQATHGRESFLRHVAKRLQGVLEQLPPGLIDHLSPESVASTLRRPEWSGLQLSWGLVLSAGMSARFAGTLREVLAERERKARAGQARRAR